jgi:metallo-beta-lactamase class B
MSKKTLAGIVVAVCMATTWQSHGAAQGGGRGNAAPPTGFPTEKQLAESQEGQRHIAAAMALAKTDLVDQAKGFCTATGVQREAVARQAQGLPPVPDVHIEPVKIFDNLYYIGFNDVGAWAIPTSDGIILIDALNTVQEAETVLAPDLMKVGLNPANVKYVIVGHGHADHWGGASYFQDKYKARVGLTAADWEMVERINPNANAQQANRPRPKRDLILTDGQKITLGDTTITIGITPGHTPGSIAMFVPVKHHGASHMAMIMSGTQMTSAASFAAFQHVFNDIAKPLKAETALNSHPGGLVNTLPTMAALRQQYPAGAHPYLLGEERFGRNMAIMLECGSARLAALAPGTR